MQEYFFEARGIAYRTSEIDHSRQTLLLVHGLSGSLSAWEPYEALFPSYNIVELDLRGHGCSVRPKRRGYRMQEFVEDIRALLAHLNLKHVHVVSHSFGTLVAMEFARAHPERVEMQIYLAPAYGAHRFRLSHFLSNMAAFLTIKFSNTQTCARTDYRRFTPAKDYDFHRIGTDIYNMGLRSYILSMQLVFARNYDTDWEEVSAPTLVIHGSSDTIVPITHGRMLAKATGAALEEISGANHILILNNVEAVAARITQFVH